MLAEKNKEDLKRTMNRISTPMQRKRSFLQEYDNEY